MMKIALRMLALTCALALSGISSADSVRDGLIGELNLIRDTFSTGYAPTEWKGKHFGWSLATEHAKALNMVSSKPVLSPADYRATITDLLRSTRDYHVGVQFAFTERATLPFLVHGANGNYFVVWTDPAKDIGVRVGDQLTEWNGQPAQTEIDSVLAEVRWSVPSTDQRLAEYTLTSRRASRAVTVPQGSVRLTFTRAGAKIKKQINWEYTPEEINWNFAPSSSVSLMNAPGSVRKIMIPKMEWGFADSWMSKKVDGQPDPSEANRFIIGGRKSFVPQLGRVLWESDASSPLHAYKYRRDDGAVIGYVRIPHYMGGEESFKAFKAFIMDCQDSTSGLIIDQINNPGGSLFYIAALVSVLGSNPVHLPDEAIALWPAMALELIQTRNQLAGVKNDVEARAVLGNTLDGYPVNQNLAVGIVEFTKAALASWNAGNRLTKPMPFYGVENVNPDPDVQYSKPILVLTNETDFSGGDFFPAILQDNKMATIFGTRTSGAGGYILGVNGVSSLGLLGFSFTGSIAKRLNDDPIQNLGVTPDIGYKLSEADFQSGFREYGEAINKAIGGLIAAGRP